MNPFERASPLILIIALISVAGGVLFARGRFQRSLREKKLPLENGEERLGELFVIERGFLGGDSEGKVVLTTKRFLHCSHSEKRVYLALSREEIHAISIGKPAGLLDLRRPSLEVDTTRGQWMKWTIPEEKIIEGNVLVFMKDVRYKNPHTPQTFGLLLGNWIGDPSKIHVFAKDA